MWRALLESKAIKAPDGSVAEATITETNKELVLVEARGVAVPYQAVVPAEAALLEVAAWRLVTVLERTRGPIQEPVHHHTGSPSRRSA